MGAGEVVIPKEQHNNWFSSAKSSALKTQTTFYVLSHLYIGIQKYRHITISNKYVDAITFNEKRAHEFNGE